MIEKVVGTTFSFSEFGHHKFDDFVGVNKIIADKNLTIRTGPAYLIPEPDNQFDPTAVAVVAHLINGEDFKLGYLPKDSPIKATITHKTFAQLITQAYSQTDGLNDSYSVNILLQKEDIN